MSTTETSPTPAPAGASVNYAKITATYGFDERNAQGPGHLTPDTPGPWDPWCAKVMILAGWTYGFPWLFLACRDCGWVLGYERQFDIAELAKAAKAHEENCEVQGS